MEKMNGEFRSPEHYTEQLAEQFHDFTESLRQRASDLADEAGTRTSEYYDEATEWMDKNSGKLAGTVAVLAAVGLLGFYLGRKRKSPTELRASDDPEAQP